MVVAATPGSGYDASGSVAEGYSFDVATGGTVSFETTMSSMPNSPRSTMATTRATAAIPAKPGASDPT